MVCLESKASTRTLQSESIKSIHFLNCPGFFTEAFFMKYFQPYFFSMLSCIFWYHFHDLKIHAWLHRRQTLGEVQNDLRQKSSLKTHDKDRTRSYNLTWHTSNTFFEITLLVTMTTTFLTRLWGMTGHISSLWSMVQLEGEGSYG